MDPASFPAKFSYYVYAVVNTAVTPTNVVRYEMTRALAREFVRWQPNADQLRIRRGRVTLYQT